MKRELEHFTIGDSYGGNQDWFPTFMMHIGGCGAETACDSSVYFAMHRGLKSIAPENAATLSRRDYVRFAYRMKPYLSPRRTGIDRLDIYIDGYAKYLNDCGETRLSMTPFDGAKPFDAAAAAVYLHGLAGDIAAEKLGKISMLPSDMIECISEALRACSVS